MIFFTIAVAVVYVFANLNIRRAALSSNSTHAAPSHHNTARRQSTSPPQITTRKYPLKHFQHFGYRFKSPIFYFICIFTIVICWMWQRDTIMDQQLNGHSSPLHDATIEQTKNMLENISLLSKTQDYTGHDDDANKPLRIESLNPALLPSNDAVTTTATSQKRLIIIGDVHGCKASCKYPTYF